VDGNLHFPVASIKPSLQHFQFCCAELSLGILFSSILDFISHNVKQLTTTTIIHHKQYLTSLLAYILTFVVVTHEI
jgi:hypothetical protein